MVTLVRRLGVTSRAVNVAALAALALAVSLGIWLWPRSSDLRVHITKMSESGESSDCTALNAAYGEGSPSGSVRIRHGETEQLLERGDLELFGSTGPADGFRCNMTLTLEDLPILESYVVQIELDGEETHEWVLQRHFIDSRRWVLRYDYEERKWNLP